jgi:Ca2+/H+ antiporter
MELITMILAFATAIVCFAAAIIMLTPYFRKITLLRPMAFYLIFQGAWQIFSYLIYELYPTSPVPGYVDRIGTILIVLYYIFILFMTRTKSKRKKRDK